MKKNIYKILFLLAIVFISSGATCTNGRYKEYYNDPCSSLTNIAPKDCVGTNCEAALKLETKCELGMSSYKEQCIAIEKWPKRNPNEIINTNTYCVAGNQSGCSDYATVSTTYEGVCRTGRYSLTDTSIRECAYNFSEFSATQDEKKQFCVFGSGDKCMTYKDACKNQSSMVDICICKKLELDYGPYKYNDATVSKICNINLSDIEKEKCVETKPNNTGSDCLTYEKACKENKMTYVTKDMCYYLGITSESSSFDYTADNGLIFNSETPNCAGGSKAANSSNIIKNGDIKHFSWEKKYTPIVEQTTHPGGYYDVGFEYYAELNLIYKSGLSLIQCIADINGVEVETECKNVNKTIKIAPLNFNFDWNDHPDTLYLYDDLDGSTKDLQVKMTYKMNKYKDDNGSATIYYNKEGISNTAYLDKETGTLYKNIVGTDVNTGQKLGVDDVYDVEVVSGKPLESKISGSASKTVGCYSNASFGTCAEIAKDAAVAPFSIENYYFTSNVDCSGCSGENEYKTCTKTCFGRASAPTRAKYAKIYTQIYGEESGTYSIDQEDAIRVFKEKVSNRLNPLAYKFTNPNATTGRYLYYIEDKSGTDFGKRHCDLNIIGGDENKIFSDLIFYRPVDLNDMFPNRQAGSNWKMDSNLIKNIITNYKPVQPMYVINLSAATMRKIAQSTTLKDYIEWKMDDTYNPMDEYGQYDNTHDYWWNMKIDGIDLSSVITRNKTAIEARNRQLVNTKVFNQYYKSLNNNKTTE